MSSPPLRRPCRPSRPWLRLEQRAAEQRDADRGDADRGDADRGDVIRLADALARAAHPAGAPPPAARVGADGTRAAAVARLGASVRAYVAAGKRAGVPPERVLVRTTDIARRHLLAFRRARDADGLRGVVFRAYLVTYYGDACRRNAGGGGEGARPRPIVPRVARPSVPRMVRPLVWPLVPALPAP